jgi:cAMP-dependent protein kinase regulator
MDSAHCTHSAAGERLADDDLEGALRILGPMLQENPSDIIAWRMAARIVHDLGETKAALKNLTSAALATAELGNPIAALTLLKEIEELGGTSTATIEKIAKLYGAGSALIEEGEISPPPLPAEVDTEPWGDDIPADQVTSRVADAMAMAWGAAMTISERQEKLPYIPLLSALEPTLFAKVFTKLERVPLIEDDVVVEQGSAGDAMFIVADGTVRVLHRSGSGEPTELARLGPGAFFGEMALVSSAPRAAEVRAAEPATLLRVSKTEMEALAAESEVIGDVLVAFCHARMLENLMRVSPVLAPVPPTRRPDVIARFDTDYRRAREVIIREGKEGPGLYLVVSGRVRVTRDEAGGPVMITDLGPGELFGEISLVMSKLSTASVTAVENTALLHLSRDDFHEATKDCPELLKGAYDIAVDREEQNRTIVGHPAIEADDLVLV